MQNVKPLGLHNFKANSKIIKYVRIRVEKTSDQQRSDYVRVKIFVDL